MGSDDANRARLAAALAAFGAPQNIVQAARNLSPTQVVFFGVSPLRVDLLASASGITLDGVPVRVIALDDLIENKRAAARPRDLEDCAELERSRAKLACDGRSSAPW